MAEIIGATIGGFFWTMLFAFTIFRKAWLDLQPDNRAQNVAMISFMVVFVLATIGYGTPIPALLYIPGGIGAYIILRNSYRKAWIEDDSTFD